MYCWQVFIGSLFHWFDRGWMRWRFLVHLQQQWQQRQRRRWQQYWTHRWSAGWSSSAVGWRWSGCGLCFEEAKETNGSNSSRSSKFYWTEWIHSLQHRSSRSHWRWTLRRSAKRFETEKKKNPLYFEDSMHQRKRKTEWRTGKWKNSIDVALKKLKDEADSKTFLQEAEVISQLRHPNIVVFLGIFEDPKAGIYIVMEYLELGSLDKLLAVEEERITIPMVENM